MKKYRLVSQAAFFVLLTLLVAACQNPKNNSYPSGTLEYPERAVTQRASSYDRDWEDGNADNLLFEPGQTHVLAELDGPERITHVWFTGFGRERGFPKSVVIRIYWDGSEHPSVEVPLGDFFAAGHGMQVNVNSSRVATSSFGRAYNCYWVMPFRKSAKVTLTNESASEPVGMYYYIDWEQRAIPRDMPYFHARYRQEYPVTPGKDYLIADIKGKGHYAGTVLSVQASHPGWFGEGDDRFYVDGDTIPTLHGTGSEDYINDAWAFRVVNRPYYGVSIWEGMNAGGRITAYRWHETDPVFFEDSLTFTIEHKGNLFYDDGSLAEAYTDTRPDLFSSVAFWYQQGVGEKFPDLPEAKNRMAEYELIQVDEYPGKIETSSGKVEDHEDMSYTNQKGLMFSPESENAMIELPFEITKAGNYLVYLRLWPRGDAGVYDFYLNDQLLVEEEDLFREHHFTTDLKIGHMHRLDTGKNYIKAVFKGTSHPGIPGNLFVDAIVLEPMADLEKIE